MPYHHKLANEKGYQCNPWQYFYPNEGSQHPLDSKKPKEPFTQELFDQIGQLDIWDHPDVQFKVADLGNACYIDHPFSEEIQTRQYRSPEVILKAGYNFGADMWSFSCMIFELITGDYLFDPTGDQGAPREEDHLAIVMEVMGRIPDNVLNRSAAHNNFFCDNGNHDIMLKHHRELKYWGLVSIMIEKYNIEPPDAVNISDFIIGGLDLDPDKRITPVELLRHPWLRG